VIETENNNSTQRANGVNWVRGNTGYLNSFYDQDWYTFTINSSSNVTVDLDVPASVDHMLTLRSSSKVLTSSTVRGIGNNERITRFLPAGKYYLIVSRQSGGLGVVKKNWYILNISSISNNAR
ncbi:MAG: pre-peptidase C-terminal domain-containing protein, partial [Armatimonadota bacterium]